MKRYNNLYGKIYDLDNIKLAHKNARKGKRHYKEVKMIDKEQDKHFLEIHNMLKNKTFRNSKYETFLKTENDKTRTIYRLPYFPDRIIHHCILQVIEPIWRKIFITDTYACIKNRGIHFGLKRLKNALKDEHNTKYCLKFDVKKFYPSINHNVLKKIIRKSIKDKDVLFILDDIIDSTDGIPIGNYLSQFFGNLYLAYFDHWMKEEKKCKYYFRYCDDIVVLHNNKSFLHKLRKDITCYLKEILDLKMKENHQLFKTDNRGIDFMGYVSFHRYILLRKTIKQKFKRKLRIIQRNKDNLSKVHIRSSIMSYIGWMKHANCKNLLDKYNKQINYLLETT